MTFEQLVDFLSSKMKMSHIYQPLLIRSLVDAGGSATPHHLLVIPKRHTPDYFSMTSHERQCAEELLCYLKNKITASNSEVTGFNVWTNCSEAAGQSIMHAHIHLMPRRMGDMDNPRLG